MRAGPCFQEDSRRLAELLKLFQRDPQLPEDFEEKWRSDFLPAVERDGYSVAVRVVPTFVTSACLVLENPNFCATL